MCKLLQLMGEFRKSAGCKWTICQKKKNTCYNEQVETEMIKKVLFRIAPQNMKFLILSTFKYVYYPFAESYFESGLKKKKSKET